MRPLEETERTMSDAKCQTCIWLREYDNGAWCGRREPKRPVEMTEVCKDYTPPAGSVKRPEGDDAK